MKRRTVLKALGIGGLIPFVRGSEVEAAPQVVQPQPQTKTYMTVGSAYLSRPSFTGIGGTVSFSVDGINWQELGKLSSWELTDGDE